MLDVYSRYRFSSYANRALAWLAGRALDGGRAEMARVAYGRLAKDPAVTAGTLLRYATAAELAGKPAEARAVLDRVRKEFGAQPVQLGGQATTGAAAADSTARSLKREAAAAPGRRWTSFGGDAGDRKMASSLTGGVKRLWEFPYPTRPDSPRTTSDRVQFSSYSYTSKLARFTFLTFPTVHGDKLWVQGPRNLTGMNLANGERVWDRQGFVLTPEEAALQVPVDAGRGRSYYRPTLRAVQGAPAVDGHLLVARMPLQGLERDGSPWPTDFAIVMVDTRDGRQLWRKIAGGDPKNVYYNLPTLQSNAVLTGTATLKGGITEYSAVALDAGTGEPLWTTYLGAGSDPFNGTDGSPAAVRDGIVWIESSLYTLNALDLVTGEVRMIYRYQPERRPGGRTGFDSAPQLTNEPVSLIASGPGPVLFAPRWGVDVVALDPAANGKLVWSSPKAPGRSTMGSLFAADDKHAYVCGDYIQAINLSDGSREWTAEFNIVASSVGYAALSGDKIYVPVEGRIHILSTADGRELEVLQTQEVVGESAGFAAVLPLDGMLLVTTRDKVIAFGPK
jgi:outer membrane protein assembly factor BamB